MLSHSVVSDSLWPRGQTPRSLGIFQARMLEWVAMPSSSRSSWPRDRTQVSCIAGGFFTIWVTREAYTRLIVSSLLPREPKSRQLRDLTDCTLSEHLLSPHYVPDPQTDPNRRCLIPAWWAGQRETNEAVMNYMTILTTYHFPRKEREGLRSSL